ncbi:MAG: DUF4198 domain-containing protein, partial [Deltaproteobacteria bacterium]
MKKLFIFIIMSINVSFSAGAALAHFGMLVPSDSMVMQNDNRTINVKLSFSHPFEGEVMELVKPVVFGVMANGEKADLLETLTKTKVMGHTAWETSYAIKRPGVYMFYMEPKP